LKQHRCHNTRSHGPPPVSLVGWGLFRANAEIFASLPSFPAVVARYSNVHAEARRLLPNESELHSGEVS
jgi:hypothetical protein